jgi:hypothetical protein
MMVWGEQLLKTSFLLYRLSTTQTFGVLGNELPRELLSRLSFSGSDLVRRQLELQRELSGCNSIGENPFVKFTD